MKTTKSILSEQVKARAWRLRDASYDGVFFLGVRTTGIVCRPSCPSRPKREHVEFFDRLSDATRAGYRFCKRCRPELADGCPPSWVADLMTRAGEAPDRRISGADLRLLGVAPEKARRWFQRHYGMTFAAWGRGLRLARAFAQLRRGEAMDDVILGHGFESHSGFRSAFGRVFGQPPGRAGAGDCLCVAMLETPMGPMLAVANEKAVCQLEFADRRELEKSYAELKRRFGLPVVPGENALLKRLRAELQDYFGGTRKTFSVPVRMVGTDFQRRVWHELQKIPFGTTASYEAIARRLGAPAAFRAVARANASNRLYLLVPCHRVIGKNGALSGYGGGVWRKRRLLDLEQRGPRSS